MSPHGTVEGEGSWQRRPGTKTPHLARGCGGEGELLPSAGCKGPTHPPWGREQLCRLNPAQCTATPPGDPQGRTRGPAPGRGGTEGHGAARCQGSELGAGAGWRDRPARPHPRGSRPGPSRGPVAGRGREGKGSGGSPGRPPALTVDVLPVADVLQVAARVLPAQLGLGAVGLQPGVGIPAQLGAGGHAAGGGVPHLLCPAPARPGSGGGEGRPVSRGGGQPWAAAETRGSGGGRGGGCGALRLHSPADLPGGSSAEAAPQRGPPAWAAAATPSSAGRQRRARRSTAPSPAGPPRSSPAPAQPPGRSTHAPTRQRRSLRGSGSRRSSRPGRPPPSGSGSSGGNASRRAGCESGGRSCARSRGTAVPGPAETGRAGSHRRCRGARPPLRPWGRPRCWGHCGPAGQRCQPAGTGRSSCPERARSPRAHPHAYIVHKRGHVVARASAGGNSSSCCRAGRSLPPAGRGAGLGTHRAGVPRSCRAARWGTPARGSPRCLCRRNPPRRPAPSPLRRPPRPLGPRVGGLGSCQRGTVTEGLQVFKDLRNSLRSC